MAHFRKRLSATPPLAQKMAEMMQPRLSPLAQKIALKMQEMEFYDKEEEEEEQPEKRLLGEVNGMGNSITVDAGSKILIEPYSHTIGADPFVYNVNYQFYDSNGKLVPNMVPLNAFGNAVPAFSRQVITGQGGGVPNLTFTAPQSSPQSYYNGRVKWHITIQRQVVTHQNSMGWNLRVYEAP